MRDRLYKYFPIFFFVALVFLSSCATKPKSIPSTYSVNIQKMDESGIHAIHSSKDVNPFIEPGSLLRGKVNEFVVFKIDISNDHDRTIRIDSIMQDKDQNYIEVYYADRFVEYWDQNSTRTSTDKTTLSNYAKKVSLIKKVVVRADTITINPGEYIYYLVFVGPYPIKRPAHAQIDISTNDGEYNSFEFLLQ